MNTKQKGYKVSSLQQSTKGIMGCAQSAEGNNKQNGENLVGPSEPPAPAPPDPRLPLTARQKYSMVASWKGISRAMETTGINMFIK